MKTFEVQATELNVPADQAYRYIADPKNLPEWTNAFKKVWDGRAVMETPDGSVEIGLEVDTASKHATIDWIMTSPNGNVARAYSRVVSAGDQSCVYSFILLAPPVPLEKLEGALEQQSQTLREEMTRLRSILAKDAA